MSDSTSKTHTGRIGFLLSSLAVVLFCAAALKLTHAHPESKRVLFAVGYGVVLLGVFWTRSLEGRLRDAGMPRWSFWPYFLIVFTGCLAAHLLKFTNSLETLALFLVLQLPAALFSRKPAAAETLSQDVDGRRSDSKATPLGAIEFAVYLLIIAGLLDVLHLLRYDVSGMAGAHILRHALDAACLLLSVPWFFSVRGRLRRLGLINWSLGYCFVVFALCAAPFASRFLSFRQVLILFVVLQIPLVILQRQFIPARFFSASASKQADSNS